MVKLISLGVAVVFAICYYVIPWIYRSIADRVEAYNRDSIPACKRTVGINIIAILAGIGTFCLAFSGAAFFGIGVSRAAFDSILGGGSLLILAALAGWLTWNLWKMRRFAGCVFLGLLAPVLFILIFLPIYGLFNIGELDEYLMGVAIDVVLLLIVSAVAYSLIKNLPRMH